MKKRVVKAVLSEAGETYYMPVPKSKEQTIGSKIKIRSKRGTTTLKVVEDDLCLKCIGNSDSKLCSGLIKTYGGCADSSRTDSTDISYAVISTHGLLSRILNYIKPW